MDCTCHVDVSRVENVSNADCLEDMLCDYGDSMHIGNVDEEPTPDAKAFYAMLSAVRDPLHDFTQTTRFTAVTRLMGIKSQYNLSGDCINNILKLWHDTLPQGNRLPTTLYECKCILGGLKMPYVKIDVCTNHCMLYYKANEKKLECDFCGEARYKVVNNDSPNKKRKPIPRKACYSKRAKQLNGENFDWKKNAVSSKALYDCSLGKPHGRWALFNGIVNDTDVIAEVRAGGGSSAALKRCRAEQNEDELRRETEKARKAESYANNVLSWGLGMYEHCNGMHKLVETLATERGMPINEIPPPPVPPPACSPSPPHGSPHQSIVNILETSQEPPALCAQQSDHSYLHEHVVTTNVPAQQPDAGAPGMFGFFFSETGTDAVSFSLLLGNQPLT